MRPYYLNVVYLSEHNFLDFILNLQDITLATDATKTKMHRIIATIKELQEGIVKNRRPVLPPGAKICIL